MIIDGKALAEKIKDKFKKQIETENLNITLAVVLVGRNKASQIYVEKKRFACKQVGIKSRLILLNENINQANLNAEIEKLSKDESVNGILLQLPLPKHLDAQQAIKFIAKEKDVDGLKVENLGRVLTNESSVTPCTAKAILSLVKSVEPNLEGKNVVVVNRSVLVGKPSALLFLNENATVTICHSKTKNLKSITKKADVLIVAVGKEKFIKKSFVKKSGIVIDVGINRNNQNKVCGDVDFDKVLKKAKHITPVPGGVGPMTVAMLLENAILLAQKYKL